MIGWWVKTDDPMGVLKGYVGQELTNDETKYDDIYVNFLVDGKSIEVDNNYECWMIIDKIDGDTASGSFGGTFKVQDGKTFKTIGTATIENGSFEAPIRKYFKNA